MTVVYRLFGLFFGQHFNALHFTGTCPSRIFVLVDILDEILKQCQPEILVIADVGEDPGS